MQPMPAEPTLLRLHLADLAATDALAGWLAARFEAGWRLYLSGDLGAGKTRLTRALLASLGHHGRVRSPTFTLAEPYNLPKFDLYHFDFYRFSSKHDWLDAGFDEILRDPHTASVVEWPEMAGDTLPAADLRLRLAFVDEGVPDGAQSLADALAHDEDAGRARQAWLEADTPRGRACLSALARAVAEDRIAGVSCAPG